MTTELAPLLKLGRAERLQLVADLWDSLAQEASIDLPVADWKCDELRRRKARLAQQPGTGRSWEEVQRHARERFDAQD